MVVEHKEILDTDGSIGYIEAIINSDNILKTTYFPKAQRLYIAFNRGGTYSYENVSPDMYQQFENAESQGKFFYQNIRNNTKHPYRKEFTLYPNEIAETKQIIEEKLNKDDEHN